MVGGDFNEILSNNEKNGGILRAKTLMEAFRDGLSDCDPMDLGFIGPIFTWFNQRAEPHTVWCSLDRFCGNSEWCNFAPWARIQHLTFSSSDHVPIFLHLRGQLTELQRRKQRPWHFNAQWIRKEECKAVIRDGWESAMASDCFDRLFGGVEACQLGLRQWSLDIHNNPRKCIKNIQEQLHALALAPQTEQTRAEGVALRAELEKVYSDEDIFWPTQ